MSSTPEEDNFLTMAITMNGLWVNCPFMRIQNNFHNKIGVGMEGMSLTGCGHGEVHGIHGARSLILNWSRVDLGPVLDVGFMQSLSAILTTNTHIEKKTCSGESTNKLCI